MGFVSFDISSLEGVTITEAVLDMGGIGKHGDVSFFGSLYLNSLNWGPNRLSNVSRAALEGEGAIIGQGYPSDGSQPIICTHNDLKKEIQKAIDDSRTRFQIRIHFSGKITDNDNYGDYWMFYYDQINLKIKYES